MASSLGRLAASAVALAAFAASSRALAGDHHRRTQVLVPVQTQAVFTGQAPVQYVASAPVQYVASAPTQYTASAPVQYVASAPVQYTASAPVQYTASAPVQYTASAPVQYPQGTVASAPATTYTIVQSAASSVGAAPVGAAPDDGTPRLSEPIQHALLADLIAAYHSSESGTTRIEKIEFIRNQAREKYLQLLGDEGDGELNGSERNLVNVLVDRAISNPAPGRAYSSIADSPYADGQQARHVGGYGGPTQVVATGYYQPPVQYVVAPAPAPAPAPASYTLVPVYRSHPAHSHGLFHKN